MKPTSSPVVTRLLWRLDLPPWLFLVGIGSALVVGAELAP